MIRIDRNKRAREWLDALLLGGLNSGDSIPVDAVFGAISGGLLSRDWNPASAFRINGIESACPENRKNCEGPKPSHKNFKKSFNSLYRIAIKAN
jgi:hypothetical protein